MSARWKNFTPVKWATSPHQSKRWLMPGWATRSRCSMLPPDEELPGYAEAKPMVVSAGLFPTEADQYPDLREALHKLQLSDAALKFEPETSSAMGFGFRCGFLGLLHMEIVQERLEREYDLDLIVTAPSVIYNVNMVDGSEELVDNPATLPDPQKPRIDRRGPYVRHGNLCAQ